jgi:hypothetical protein
MTAGGWPAVKEGTRYITGEVTEVKTSRSSDLRDTVHVASGDGPHAHRTPRPITIDPLVECDA